jgi:hypothetical protein
MTWSPFFQTFEDFGFRAVRNADVDGHFTLAVLSRT